MTRRRKVTRRSARRGLLELVGIRSAICPRGCCAVLRNDATNQARDEIDLCLGLGHSPGYRMRGWLILNRWGYMSGYKIFDLHLNSAKTYSYITIVVEAPGTIALSWTVRDDLLYSSHRKGCGLFLRLNAD